MHSKTDTLLDTKEAIGKNGFVGDGCKSVVEVEVVVVIVEVQVGFSKQRS